MGAPKGNQSWKLRSKHGRDKLFATPQLLWEAATEYFEWVDENPLTRNEAIKGGDLAGRTVAVEIGRPYTIHGLCLYLDCSVDYFKKFEQNNKDAVDFIPILTRIKETIYNQKFEGASVGLFNQSIIARDLGLVDKTDITSKGEKINELSEAELAQEIKRITKLLSDEAGK